MNKNKPFLINFVYRPPSSNRSWIDDYESQLHSAVRENKEMYLLGDRNIGFLPTSNAVKFTNKKWEILISKLGLSQIVNFPTRCDKKTSSIIDHIYTISTDLISESFVPFYSVSDHYPVCFTRSMKTKKSKTCIGMHRSITYRSFKNFNEHSLFCNDLATSP